MKISSLSYKLVAMVGLLGLSSAALAAPVCPETLDAGANYKCVVIDTGVNKYGTGTKTGGFYELGFTGSLATSIYSGLTPGSSIVDTNIKSVLNNYGLTGTGNRPVLSGGSLNFTDSATQAQRDVDALTPLGSPAPSQGLNTDFGVYNAITNPLGALSGYTLTFDYLLNGTLTATGPVFNSGYFLIYYDDLSTAGVDNTPVLRLNVTGSTLNLANLNLVGEISYDFDGTGAANDCTTSFCQNFWGYQTGAQNWYSLNASNVQISFDLNTDVSPPVPTANQLTPTVDGDGNRWLVRQTTLNSHVRFVPEPGSLAMVGLALLGLAGVASRRSRKS